MCFRDPSPLLSRKLCDSEGAGSQSRLVVLGMEEASQQGSGTFAKHHGNTGYPNERSIGKEDL